jgi:phage/conjugal plasmid C-4 type zinc finger TraR family protein
VADTADRAAEQQGVIENALLLHRPRPPRRQVSGNDCLACGKEIPAQRLAVLPNACLCVACQEDAERTMGQ